jgi:GT2 family glycosyltransferase
MNKKVSLIIVHYKANEEFFNCLRSITQHKPKTSFEVIVIDNDENPTIEEEMQKNFSWVIYRKSSKNLGFGAGNNLGAKYAKGEYLFFLNPDTKVYPHTIDNLVSFLEKDSRVGIVAPLLLNSQETPYELQGTKILTPFSGIFALSFLNKLIPHNPVSLRYWQTGWDKTKQKEVDVIPGTAFLIRKKLYEEVGGFDEKFFLFFEEFDLCKRIREIGHTIYIIPDAKVIHLWGRSTKHKKNISEIFIQSRKYYFRKHYGLLAMWLVELFTNFNKQQLILLTILLLAILLRIISISQLMPFIGDQAWFYLSARDMVQSHQIPLVGIASSHPWIHQGPLWTYMLAPILWIAQWNPLAGACLSISIGIIAIWIMYKCAAELFYPKIGLITAFLFATSPLIVLHDRMPYHTSPIPLFTLCFIYAVYRWMKGNPYSFPVICFFLALLYNFELATAVLWFVLLTIIGIKLKSLHKLQISKKILLYSFLAIALPLIPMLLYDFSHGFPQTLKFIAWLGYKLLRLFGYPSLHPTEETFNLAQFLSFTASKYQQLLFVQSTAITAIIGIISIGGFFVLCAQKLKDKRFTLNWQLTALWFTISIIGYFAGKTPSDAYLPMIFPVVILITSLVLEKMTRSIPGKIANLRLNNFLLIILLAAAASINSYELIHQNYFTVHTATLSEKQKIARQIVQITQGKSYNLKGKGPGSQFESFTMPYQYLTWQLGHPPSSKKQQIQIIIEESKTKIEVKK